MRAHVTLCRMSATQIVSDAAIRDFVIKLPVLSDPDALLSEAQSAELLGVTPRTLQAWRQRGGSREH